jgi:hypothetical protein
VCFVDETHNTTLASLRLHGIHTEVQLYWEPQTELNCLVHAYKMLRGEKLLTPDELHSHTCNNLQVDASYLHMVSLAPTDLCESRVIFPFIVLIITASPHRAQPSLANV